MKKKNSWYVPAGVLLIVLAAVGLIFWGNNISSNIVGEISKTLTATLVSPSENTMFKEGETINTQIQAGVVRQRRLFCGLEFINNKGIVFPIVPVPSSLTESSKGVVNCYNQQIWVNQTQENLKTCMCDPIQFKLETKHFLSGAYGTGYLLARLINFDPAVSGPLTASTTTRVDKKISITALPLLTVNLLSPKANTATKVIETMTFIANVSNAKESWMFCGINFIDNKGKTYPILSEPANLTQLSAMGMVNCSEQKWYSQTQVCMCNTVFFGLKPGYVQSFNGAPGIGYIEAKVSNFNPYAVNPSASKITTSSKVPINVAAYTAPVTTTPTTTPTGINPPIGTGYKSLTAVFVSPKAGTSYKLGNSVTAQLKAGVVRQRRLFCGLEFIDAKGAVFPIVPVPSSLTESSKGVTNCYMQQEWKSQTQENLKMCACSPISFNLEAKHLQSLSGTSGTGYLLARLINFDPAVSSPLTASTTTRLDLKTPITLTK